MAELARPWELLALDDGEERTFAVLGAERGTVTIMPLGTAAPKTLPALRLFVEPSDKPAGPHYYDVTAATLRAQLEGQLFAPTYAPRVFTIGKIGIAPAARFTVRSRPQEVESRS
jgi:hypothetical protein